MQAATVNACMEAFSNLAPTRRQLSIELLQFEDRVEVAISREGEAGPVLGLDTIAKSSTKALAGVDRVQYEQLGKASVTRLIKYLARHS